MPVISADSDHPLVIEHVRTTARDLGSFPATLIANISLVTAST